jgi:hypothetical protein
LTIHGSKPRPPHFGDESWDDRSALAMALTLYPPRPVRVFIGLGLIDKATGGADLPEPAITGPEQ